MRDDAAMRDDDLRRVLRSGTSEFAALADVPDPALIRQRGDRRRRRKLILSGLLAFAVGAGGGGLAYANLDTSAHSAASGPAPGAAAASSAGSGAGGVPAESAAPAASPGIVAVTTAGLVEVLDPETLDATKQLSGDQDAVGDEISVTPDGKTVYFAAKQGCAAHVMSVPVNGGAPAAQVANGVLPSVSPDGRKLAFVREPYSGGPAPRVRYECGTGGMASLVIMDLPSGSSTTRPIGTLPISHISWSADGASVLLSAGPADGNKGWQLDTVLVNGTGGIGTIPVTGENAPSSYYREGIYLPGGGLLVNRICCDDASVKPASSLILRIDQAGNEVRRIAKAFADKDHTSMTADPSGHWIMYLSGSDLFVSHDGGAPRQVSAGLIAVAWL